MSQNITASSRFKGVWCRARRNVGAGRGAASEGAADGSLVHPLRTRIISQRGKNWAFGRQASVFLSERGRRDAVERRLRCAAYQRPPVNATDREWSSAVRGLDRIATWKRFATPRLSVTKEAADVSRTVSRTGEPPAVVNATDRKRPSAVRGLHRVAAWQRFATPRLSVGSEAVSWSWSTEPADVSRTAAADLTGIGAPRWLAAAAHTPRRARGRLALQ